MLCDLQGKTHHEAARILGLPVGTVSSRLVRARDKLRKRLVRRGLSFSAGAIATVCAHDAARAALLPAALVAATARAAVQFVAGGTTAAAIPSTLVSLVKTVSKSLLIGKLTATGTMLTMSVVLAGTIGAAAVAVRLVGQEPSGPFERRHR